MVVGKHFNIIQKTVHCATCQVKTALFAYPVQGHRSCSLSQYPLVKWSSSLSVTGLTHTDTFMCTSHIICMSLDRLVMSGAARWLGG